MEELYSKQFTSTIVHKWLVYLEYVSGNCLIEGFEVLNETSKIFIIDIYFNSPGAAMEGGVLGV